MTEKKKEITKQERNLLLTFDPYENGVEIEIKAFKPKILITLRDLVSRGYCIETIISPTLSRINLTAKAKKITR